MVAEPIKLRVTKMPPKKGHVGRKFKGQSDNLAFRAAKAASDAAVASTGLNPSPMGRPWPTHSETFKRILTTFEAPISHLTEPVRPKIAVCPNFGSRASPML